MRMIFALLLLAFGLPAAARPASRPRPPLVLAAASLQEALGAAAAAWAEAGHATPSVSFAASSALARQIAGGAPADLFLSADADWMDDVERRGLIVPGTRANLVGNRLVVVAAAAAPTTNAGPPLGTMRGAALGRVLGAGPLAMADPDSVPAGKYGKAALERLGAWAAVAPRVVRAENVRAALALVERGAAPYGIVYATDAKASKLRVAGVFPARSHAPIVYPVARLKASTSPEAEGFRRFLLSAQGKAIFRRYGFLTR